MKNLYPFQSGDWIDAEGDFAIVESIAPMYYECFDAEISDDVAVGDYKHTIIAYHTFCNHNGRVCSSKAQIKNLDFCDWIKPLTPEQSSLLEQITTKRAKAFAAWEAKCKEAYDYITIYVETEQGQARNALSSLRKASKVLPERFTFNDLQTILKSISSVRPYSASTECDGAEYVSFELCYKLNEQQGKHLKFYRIREFDCTEDLSTFLTFEGVFISMYHLAKIYGQIHNSEECTTLAETLKTASFALFSHDFKSNRLAKDFYKNAPKSNYTFEQAYGTMEAFFCRNAEELGNVELINQVSKKNDEVVKLYHNILGL